jgi:hypothetical protein
MPHIRGIKGEVVVVYSEALDHEEDRVSSAFLKGKQNGIFFNKFISHL